MAAATKGESEPGPLVLIIDDYDDTRFLFTTVLTSLGFRVAQADCGEKGVAAARELGPDIVVTDLSLPDLDGSEVTRRLKAAPETREIPVLCFSAHGSSSRIRQAMEAGCSSYLCKMRSPKALAEEIRRLLGEGE